MPPIPSCIAFLCVIKPWVLSIIITELPIDCVNTNNDFIPIVNFLEGVVTCLKRLKNVEDLYKKTVNFNNLLKPDL